MATSKTEKRSKLEKLAKGRDPLLAAIARERLRKLDYARKRERQRTGLLNRALAKVR